MLNLIFIVLTSAFGLAYIYIRHKYSYRINRNVYSPKPVFPLGNFNGLGMTRHLSEVAQDIYKDVKGKAPFAGIYLFTHPTVVIADLDLIKNILVRDFDYFRNRPFYYNEKDDPLSAHLIAIEDTKWKDLRTKLSPMFTGGQMKMIFGTTLQIANEMINYMNTIADQGNSFDVKDMMSRFTADVVGSCAFGIDCNSIKNPESEFCVIGRAFFNPTTWEQFKQFFGHAFPELARTIGLRFIRSEISDFFVKAVKETVKFRNENNFERKDFLQMLLEIQKEHNTRNVIFSDLDIAAQSFVIFLAGYETSAATITFALYELARHPEIQNCLRCEINKVIDKHNGMLTYEVTNEIRYLDQVINETLRKYPAGDTLLRKATRDYHVPGTNHIIEKGTNVYIPVYGLHHDPELFPNPEKFEPDRFTEANAAERHAFSFLPFGEGPRFCIGQRFGMMQMRLGLISVIRNFHLMTCSETPERITFMKRGIILSSDRIIMLKARCVNRSVNIRQV